MKQYVCKIKVITLLSLTFFSQVVSAAFTLNGTRFIYQEGIDSSVIEVTNHSKSDYAGQAWIENTNNKKKVSFVTLPSFFEIKAEKSQVLQVIKVIDDLPSDRESLFWLNVQEIPKVDDNKSNKMVVAINTRVKLLYRPDSLKEKRLNAEEFISFSVKNGNLYLRNPTGFYFAIQSIKHFDKELSLNLENGTLAPFSIVKVSKIKGAPKELIIDAIDDYGAVNSFVVHEN